MKRPLTHPTFPALNIDTQNWSELQETVFFDNADYFGKKDELYNSYYKNQYIVDSKGQVYQIVDLKLPIERWRRVFGFLPNVYLSQLCFENTGKTISWEAVQQIYINGLQNIGVLTESLKKQITGTKCIDEMLRIEWM